MPAICKSICFANRLLFGLVAFMWTTPWVSAQFRHDRHAEAVPVGDSTRDARDKALKSIPFAQLTPQANSKLTSVIDGSSYFRRMPTQTLQCEPELLICLARNPEVLVSIWDSMGITRVSLDRTAQYQHAGNDGAGTTCKLDLIYGNDSTHVYFVEGDYSGPMWPKQLTGRSIIVLHQAPAKEVDGLRRLTVWMDVFLKVDNLGADLVVRTLSPLVSKTADSNFVESVAFVEQISQAAMYNPSGLQNLVAHLNVSQPTKEQFLQAAKIAAARANHGVNDISRNDSPKSGQSGYSVATASNGPSNALPPVTQGLSKNAAAPAKKEADVREEVGVSRQAGQSGLGDSISTRKGHASTQTLKADPADSPTIRRLNSDRQ